MLALGHAGISLLLYAPIAYVLLVAGRERAMTTGVLVVLLLTPLPDVDVVLPFVAHRAITHSLLAAVCLGVGGGAAGWTSGLWSVGDGSERAALGFLVGSLSVVSHLLGDVITPMGLRLLYPVDRTWYTLDLVSAFDLGANRAMFVAGAVAFWLALHQGRLRVAARDDAERPSATAATSHAPDAEHGGTPPGHSPVRTPAPTPDRPGTDITAPDVGD